MKIRELMKEFVPCEVCGNGDIDRFALHVFVHHKPYVVCCECEEKYFYKNAEEATSGFEKARRIKNLSSYLLSSMGV